MAECDIALIGLAVMGQNFIMNMNDHGFRVCAFNRTVSKVTDFLNGSAKGSNVVGATSIEDMCAKLKRPRRIMLLVKAGKPVDDFIELLLPHLEKGDIIIDGGNSEYVDTNRRCQYVEGKGLLYVGSGISGGEEGARNGPSLMPGGSPEAWPHIKEIFQSSAAKAATGEPCCDWVGAGGAGHFVKMVHNGIEYGDMQLIAETYHLMRSGLHMENDAIAAVFERWNNGDLESYLIEITAAILKYRDDKGYLVDRILDRAGQKGTGKWTSINALEKFTPLTLITEAVFSRYLSALKNERQAAEKLFSGSVNAPGSLIKSGIVTDQEKFIDDLASALYASKLISYAQGFMLMRTADAEFGWNLNQGSIALMWRGGCIIRSRFLGNIKAAFDKKPDLQNLIMDEFFRKAVVSSESGWRRVVSCAVQAGISVPCMSSALAFFDGYRSGRLPANMIQAQRDYFGAHQYELVDGEPGVFHHTDWTGHGGGVSSTAYQA